MSVSAKKEVVIKDACILFDLIDLGLLAAFYRLDVIVFTTNQVIAEITNNVQLAEVNIYIENGNLKIDDAGSFELISSIALENSGLSFSDASVLEVAGRRSACVLSSDKSLRNVSLRNGLVVRGMLWIIEELYNHGLIELNILFEKLNLYPDVNKRAPKKEIQLMLEKYSQPLN